MNRQTSPTPSAPPAPARAGRSRLMRALTTLMLSLGLATGLMFGSSGTATADEIGQAPTSSNITGSGSFTVTSAAVTGQSGFGGGQVYYPSTAGAYPVVAVSPGFTASWSSISWLGPRLASWGFVVVGINTNSVYDQPASRGTQLLAALNWAVNSAPTAVRSRADGTRRGVMGHSMGGGGSLEALAADTTGLVKAAVPLAPWDSDKTWNNVSEPVAIVGGQSDTVASPSSHAIPFYNTLAGQKEYVEMSGASHGAPAASNTTTSRVMVSWFKRYLNNDTRFTPFTCGYSGSAISSFLTNAC
ncbi:poly(ethylene terephthalate) hydrolase family protein [Streptomyces sp. NBC_00328]|uniref:poly(ethylene terephthalate) hydrolase family protein n=1 Tax=Streptomyces sp. NBC_00328 TaxID=2903646 RepID=UPI002E2B378D|nr:alpha/beta hydrolase [Streptomyces sp. NBC_00328]